MHETIYEMLGIEKVDFYEVSVTHEWDNIMESIQRLCLLRACKFAGEQLDGKACDETRAKFDVDAGLLNELRSVVTSIKGDMEKL